MSVEKVAGQAKGEESGTGVLWDSPHHWFLLRGLARESGHWGDFPEQLQKEFPQARVSFLEIPGSGRYRDRESPMSIAEMARWIRQEFVREKAAAGTENSPCFVLSISLGGMVTLEWLRQFESDVTGAVLMNSSLRGFSPMWKRLQPRALLTLLRAVVSKSVDERESRILALVSNREESRKRALPLWIRLHRERAIPLVNALKQLLAAAIHRPVKPRVLPPLLILNSQGDRLAHFSCSEDIARSFGVATVTHEWAGHDLPLDDASWVLKQLRNWRPDA